MSEYELPAFDGDSLDPYDAPPLPPQMRALIPAQTVAATPPPTTREIEADRVVDFEAYARQENAASFDTSTSSATVPPRMVPYAIKCRCGSKMGYRDPASTAFCAGCGRKL